MPVYRANTQYLSKSIESILKQKYQNLELLVLLDKYPNTREDREISIVLEKYEKDSRLKVIRNSTRKGFVGSLNQGLTLAEGEFIARMDSDDISFLSRISTEVQTLEKKDYDFVGGWAEVIDEESNAGGLLTPPVKPSDIRRKILLHNPFIHGSMMFTRSFIEEVGPYDPTLLGAEDYDLYLRGLSMGYIGANIPQPLLYLRINGHSITRGGEWWKTRISYSRSKFRAVTEYGYSSPPDIVAALLSVISILIPPSFVLNIKSAIGWYNPIARSSRRELLKNHQSYEIP